MSTKLQRLERRVDKISKEVKEIKEQLGFLPEIVNPLEWTSLDLFDKRVVEVLLRAKDFVSSVKIAEKLKEHRGKVWRHLKRIERISGKLKGEPIVVYDHSRKAWSMNWDEYEFRVDTEGKGK